MKINVSIMYYFFKRKELTAEVLMYCEFSEIKDPILPYFPHHKVHIKAFNKKLLIFSKIDGVPFNPVRHMYAL